MSISIAAIKGDILDLMDAALTETSDAEAARDAFAEGLATIIANTIDTYVESTVITPALANGAGAVSGTITISGEVLP